MLRFQSELPQLPVPALTDTCALYLELVRPLLSEHEYMATQRAVAEFARPGGSGEELQSRLLKWSEVRDNWLEPFWDEWYLCDDTPLVVNVSPGFLLTGGDRLQIERAARLLAAAVRVKELIDGEDLEPDSTAALPAACATTLTRSVLSTSALPSSPGVAPSCFGPVVDEGFGLSYTAHDDSLVCVVTNFHGLANDFAGELERSLEEMDTLLAA